MSKYIFLFTLLFSGIVEAQTALTVQEISETAWTQELTAANQSAGNTIANPNGDVFLILKSTTGTSSVVIAARNATVTIPGYGPLTKSNMTVTVASGATKIVGPFVSRSWNSSAGNLVLSYAGLSIASTEVKALRLKNYK
jgi:hypothetical protein